MARPLKILVVDDDVDAADSLAELFELEGHAVEVAYSGQEAIDAYRRAHFDIAFMDIMMPGKNGVESFFEIRKLRPAAQVYMMTGYSVEQLIEQAIENGALGVLSKPVDLDKVLSALEQTKPAGVVLVAEDDPDFGPQLRELIETAGYECVLVENGRHCLDRIIAGGVDVLILDLKLPVIDGIEVYASLKEGNRQVPTIIITGYAAEHRDMLESLNDMSVTGVLTKPFNPDVLIGKLQQLAC